MRDFQRGWYMQLLLLSADNSERLGYLKLDSDLWKLAGAMRKDFFDSHKSVVLACFKTKEIDGEPWIYNERLLKTIEDQLQKLNRKIGRNGVDCSSEITETKRTKGRKRSLSISSLSFSEGGGSGGSTKPGIEEVRAYCKERGSVIDADHWYAFYESNGWKVGRNSMRDWRAAVRTWEKRNGFNKGEVKVNEELCEYCKGPKWVPSKYQQGRFAECDCRAVGARNPGSTD